MAAADGVDRIVEQWASVRPDLDAAPILIWGRIARLQQQADAALRPPFAAADLAPGDFNVLAALRRSGEPYAVRPAVLSRELLTTTGGITKRIDRLARQGYVRRETATDDGRGILVRLTGAGVALVDRLMAVHLANEDALLRGLTRAERAALARLLAKLEAGVKAPESGEPR